MVAIDPELGPTRIGGVGGIANPSFVATHPTQPLVYSVSEVGLASDGTHGGVHVIEMDEVGGRIDLVPLGGLSTTGDHPCHIGVDPRGDWMVVSNYGSGDVVVLRLTDGGRVAERTSRIQHSGRGPDDSRQRGPHPHSAVFSPSGEFVVVADLGIDQVVTYGLDRDEGVLVRHEVHRAAPGSGPRMSAFHPGGGFLCTINELANTVTSWAWVEETGTLRPIATVPTLPDDVEPGGLAADLGFSTSGEHLHVSNRGHDSIATLSFDRAGGLTMLGTVPSGGAWPRAIGTDPTGDGIVVANEHGDRLAVVPPAGTGIGRGDSGPPSLHLPRPSSIAFA